MDDFKKTLVNFFLTYVQTCKIKHLVAANGSEIVMLVQ
jgi:hypothetical protein